MQNVIAIIIGIAAFIYVLKIIINQLSQSETNPKCENCPIPKLMESSQRGK